MEKINGKIAVVLLLDDEIKEEVNKISSDYKNNKILFEEQGGKCIPHITLFQTKVKNLSKEKAEELLSSIVLKLPIKLSLSRIDSFGGHFVFWHAEKEKELISLHKQSLFLSNFFDSEGEQQADSEKLTLPEKQIENVREFGYPFVGEEWPPHITIAYTQNDPEIKQSFKNITTLIKKVALVEVGEFGTIKKILEVKSV